MKGCEFLKTCTFFLQFGHRNSKVWKGLVSFYCLGRGVERCERRLCYLQKGVFPADDIMPSGETIPKVFLSLD